MIDITAILDKPIVSFDTETTGTDTKKDRIIQFAGTKLFPDGSETVLDTYINPQIPILNSDIHGITDEDVMHAETMQEAAMRIHSFISRCHLTGYNVWFDIQILAEELARYGYLIDLTGIQVIDVSIIYKKQQPRTLSAAHKHYFGTEIEGVHTALADSRASFNILKKMLETPTEEMGSSLDTLAQYSGSNNSTRVDFAGCFGKNKDGDIIFNIGQKTKGEKVSTNPGFLQWMLNQDFSADTKMWARKLLTQ